MLDRQDTETTARLELRALERMIGALCEHTERLTSGARSRGGLSSREADFQFQAFAERRTQAQQVLTVVNREPHEIRIARLEKLVEALECSRAYFRTVAGEVAPPGQGQERPRWSLLISQRVQ